MTANRGPGVAVNAGVGTTTLEHRLQLAGQYAENSPGVPRSGVLAQATTSLVTGKATMAYDIAPCSLVINRTASEGVYTPTLTGTTTVATTAAPASGSRWDLVWVKQNDVAKGDTDNLAIVGITQGASGASPTKPYASIPTGAYVLAEAQIFAATTGTSGGSNTITQVWRHTATRGAPIPVRNQAERDEITIPSTGTQVVRLDLGSRPYWWNGTRWTSGGIGTPYTPIWTGVTDFGSGGSLTGTYWVDGDRVHVRSRAKFGTAATIGTAAIYCPLPPGYPVAGTETGTLGTGFHVNNAGVLRPLVVFAGSSTTASVWSAQFPVNTLGSAGCTAAATEYIEISLSYQTSIT